MGYSEIDILLLRISNSATSGEKNMREKKQPAVYLEVTTNKRYPGNQTAAVHMGEALHSECAYD